MARFIGNPLTLGSIGGGAGNLRMTPAERARHLYVVGATRTGKSKLLEDCIRQDILAWPKSGCGMLLMDRHGTLFDNVVKWTAKNDMVNWPIVPIDLRRSDWVVSYNPLRRRVNGEEQSVVVGNFVRSILHAWGQTDSNATPRLAKWLEATLFVLHTNGFTLAEALQVIVSPEVRRSLTASLEDVVARSIWETAPVKEAEFLEMVESTVSRIRKFLSRRVMRATLGQNDVSLDLSQALEEGQILLVALATEGGKIDEEDASTIGSLLLSDLWMAAKSRGKRDEGGVKPFYVYLDEFQEYVTPSMAETLDQASGFGLHMTFAHQFPSQLLKSDHGQQLYNSVMANCRSKVVFQVEHNDDVETLTTMLFRQQVDIHQVKRELYTTKVVAHELHYLPSYGQGTSRSDGGGTQESHTDGTSQTEGTNWGRSESENDSLAVSLGTNQSASRSNSENQSLTDGTNTTLSRSRGTGCAENETQGSNWGEGEGQSTGQSATSGANWNQSRGTNEGTSNTKTTNRSQSIALGPPNELLQEELGEFWEGELDKPGEEDAFKRDWGQSMSMTHGESESTGTNSGTSAGESAGGNMALSRTAGTSENQSRGGSSSRGLTRSSNESSGEADGTSLAQTSGTGQSDGSTKGTSAGITIGSGSARTGSVGGSESWGTNSADTSGTNTSWSDATSKTITLSPMLIPIYGEELSSVTFESVQNQLFAYAQYLSGQPDRHCVAKIVGKEPTPLVTLTVKDACTTDEWVSEWTTMTVQGLSFAVPMDRALANIDARHQEISNRLFACHGEPATTRIAVDVKPGPGGEGMGALKRMRRV